MCGRYSITTAPEGIRQLFGLKGPTPNLKARYNVAPTQDAPVVRLTDLAGSILTEARHRLRSQAIDLRHAVTLSVNAQSCYRLRCSGGVIWEIPDKRRISK